ncbi:MAG: 16S rRNA (guanine(527)-N(7))-methyltransferase RsmG [Candidatus Acidiferrales bacterium]
MDQLEDAQIVAALRPYYETPLSSHFCDQTRSYIALLLRWNRRMSLTTVTDPAQILRFHFGESLFAIGHVPIRHGRLADVGSGAGFPAVPIRMAIDGLSVTLIESNRRKCAFLSEVVRELALANVEVYAERMADLEDQSAHFDFTSARAVAIDDTYLRWAENCLGTGGKVILWLGQEDSAKVCTSKRFGWRAPIKIPNSDRRYLLIGERRGETQIPE